MDGTEQGYTDVALFLAFFLPVFGLLFFFLPSKRFQILVLLLDNSFGCVVGCVPWETWKI